MKNKPNFFDITNYTSFNMTNASINFIILLCIISFFCLIYIFHYLNLDLILQKMFYSQIHGWYTNSQDLSIKMIFYIIPKKIITIFLISILFLTIKSILIKNYVKAKIFSYIIISSITCLLLISFLKHTTNMYCPDTLTQFGGSKIYTRLFDSSPFHETTNKPGKCFPAGHASAGYSLIGIALILKNKTQKIYFGLGIFLLGSIMGAYQVTRGVHFISDNIVSFILSLTSSLIIYKVFIISKGGFNEQNNN